MSIPKFKKTNGLEYVDNSYVIQVETLRLVSKLNKKWTNIYIIPIEKYVCKQAELVSMANSVNPIRYKDILLRRVLLIFSKFCMDVLDKKLTDMVEILGTLYDKQYKLLKDVLEKEFPQDALINFYNNINEVRIRRNNLLFLIGADGVYFFKSNKINYGSLYSLNHELFHVASSASNSESNIGYTGFNREFNYR